MKMSLTIVPLLLVAAVAGGRAADPQSDLLNGPRLYVMDCGFIPAMNPELYGLTAAELTSAADFVTPCYLVVHPGGTLLFDVGQIPDSEFPADGSPADAGFFRADRPLLPQLAEIGYAPEDITYMAMSHYHLDHSANANAFAGSTWIVQRAERDAMFAENAPGITNRSYYDQLEDADTVILEGEDYDVFGDGTVVLEFTPGHTPGHQSLYLDLASRGPVLLAGDLYHYVEERELDRVPSFDFDQEMTRATRRQVEAFLVETGAELWINHNLELFESLEKSPAFYD